MLYFILGFMFLIFGMFAVIFGIDYRNMRQRHARCNRTATGIVTNVWESLQTITDHDYEGGTRQVWMSQPYIEFVAEDGNTYKADVEIWHSRLPKELQKGCSVQVFYESADPKNSYIKETKINLIVTVVFGGVAALMLFVMAVMAYIQIFWL